MRPIRNFTRPRTSASLLRGSVIANARTSSIVTTAPRRSGYELAVLGGRWRWLGLSPVWSPHLVISEEDIDKLASAARELELSASVYLEQDFVMNLLETVLDYMLQTDVVVKALEHFRQKRWNEARSLDDLERLMAGFPDDQAGNTVLAQHLWGYNFWTRAKQLRELARYFRSIGVIDQEQLRQWALRSTFKRGANDPIRAPRIGSRRHPPAPRERLMEADLVARALTPPPMRL
jgi:hypothetical protein